MFVKMFEISSKLKVYYLYDYYYNIEKVFKVEKLDQSVLLRIHEFILEKAIEKHNKEEITTIFSKMISLVKNNPDEKNKTILRDNFSKL